MGNNHLIYELGLSPLKIGDKIVVVALSAEGYDSKNSGQVLYTHDVERESEIKAWVEKLVLHDEYLIWPSLNRW